MDKLTKKTCPICGKMFTEINLNLKQNEETLINKVDNMLKELNSNLNFINDKESNSFPFFESKKIWLMKMMMKQ